MIYLINFFLLGIYLNRIFSANDFKDAQQSQLDVIEVDEISEQEFYPSEDISNEDSCSFQKISSNENNLNKNKDTKLLTIDELTSFNAMIESQLLHFAVETKRKLLVVYVLITKSAEQREKIIDILRDKYGSTWIKKLQHIGNSFWKTSRQVIKALTTKIEEYNTEMLNSRFEFLTRSYSKLNKILPEALKPLFKIKSKIFNSYMLTEILLESSSNERQKLKNAFFSKYKVNLVDVIKKKLNTKSANFHTSLLNNERIIKDKSKIINMIQNATKLLQEAKELKSKSKVVERLANIIGEFPVEILLESNRIYKKTHNTSLFTVENACLRSSIIYTTAKFLDDPFEYYANNIKTLLDQKDFGFYLSRIFFAYPKQKLYKIANSFKVLFNVNLIDYIKSRLTELSLGKFNEITGRYDSYATYLRALLASLGDLEWCNGNCRITQIEEKIEN